MLSWLNAVPWWAMSLLANLSIMGIEYFNHAGNYGSWAQTLLRTGPMIVVAQWALYRSFAGAEHWLVAAAVFSLGNAGTRLLGVWLWGGSEVESWTLTVAGTSLMVAGALFIKGGMR